jgi:DNA polymerase III gamma/tau subunit
VAMPMLILGKAMGAWARATGRHEDDTAAGTAMSSHALPDCRAMSNQPLIVRHRPNAFAKVCGNNETVAALERRINDPRRPHAYLLTGPSGVGKTTIARIIGSNLQSNIIEVDAATNSGADAMRTLVEIGYYMVPGHQSRLIIIDECHALSRTAWQAALKVLEEPPDHLYLALCTTELARIPETIITRCHHVKLDRLHDAQIADLLIDILSKEGWADTILDNVFQLVVQEALGSPRRALSLLQAVYDAPSYAEAQRIIAIQGSASPMIQALNVLIKGQGWEAVRPMLAQLSDDDFSEGALVLASRYIIGAMNREESGKRAERLWEMLASFSCPVHSYDPKSVFYTAIGRILWSKV